MTGRFFLLRRATETGRTHSDSTSSSSSSESEQEEVHCLMTKQTTDDEEIKAENRCLKNSSVEPSTAQLGETDSLQTELSKLHETQKTLNDKSGLGFGFGESSSEETSTQSNLANDNFKKMNFVKASVTHDAYESVKYDDQTMGLLNHKGKTGSVGLLSKSSSILYQSWKLRVVQGEIVRRQKLIPVRVVVRAGSLRVLALRSRS
ncbi:hypothetical protein F511_26462 [Dorcoceras hygrometricum]|uniref:Uncharacterized protein n=1 Tax=Dorcoceras hygrometricum TaxID=472368 RepID=A0A2Z7CZ49_9LAMI|nr:hypothetical protein F511_26462 [Dorcoceras hygrometricum]